MVPFTVLQKQEGRGGNVVSYVRLLKVLVYDRVYELRREGFFRDNIKLNVPYKGENGVTVNRQGHMLILTTSFGLTVRFAAFWSEILLVDAYANHVCGLCGNADGNRNNDFVDRNNRPVKLSGNIYSQYFQWGSNWRDGKDTDRDIDGKRFVNLKIYLNIKQNCTYK